jgi:hypothetical protein
MSNDLPEWYHRAWQLKALRGETIDLPPEPESNVHSIAAARTRGLHR